MKEMPKSPTQAKQKRLLSLDPHTISEKSVHRKRWYSRNQIVIPLRFGLQIRDPRKQVWYLCAANNRSRRRHTEIFSEPVDRTTPGDHSIVWHVEGRQKSVSLGHDLNELDL